MTLETRPLGRSGLAVTRVGFGAWAIGGRGYGPVSDKEATSALDAYLTGGGNFIDTAHGYGASEEIIGGFLQRNPPDHDLVLATKCASHDPAVIREQTETSLRRLQVDKIDLHYLHSPPEDRDTLGRVLDVYESLREEGKIAAIGASIKGPAVTPATEALCRQYIADGRVDAFQLIFSILRQRNRRVFADARAAGIGIVARTVLESGFLSGKFAREYEFAEGDHRRRWGPARWETICDEIDWLKQHAAHDIDQDLAAIAIRFALDEPDIDTIIPGGKRASQVRANFRAGEMAPLPEMLRDALIERYRDRSADFNPG